MLFLPGYATAGTAEDVYMAFVVWAFKETRDQVFFLRYRFLADRADPRKVIFNERVTMRTTEDMADFVILAGIHGRFDLLTA